MGIDLSDKQAAALKELQRLRRATSKQVASGLDVQAAAVTKMFTTLERSGGVMRRPGTKPVQWIMTNIGIEALRERGKK